MGCLHVCPNLVVVVIRPSLPTYVVLQRHGKSFQFPACRETFGLSASQSMTILSLIIKTVAAGLYRGEQLKVWPSQS